MYFSLNSLAADKIQAVEMDGFESPYICNEEMSK